MMVDVFSFGMVLLEVGQASHMSRAACLEDHYAIKLLFFAWVEWIFAGSLSRCIVAYAETGGAAGFCCAAAANKVRDWFHL